MKILDRWFEPYRITPLETEATCRSWGAQWGLFDAQIWKVILKLRVHSVNKVVFRICKKKIGVKFFTSCFELSWVFLSCEILSWWIKYLLDNGLRHFSKHFNGKESKKFRIFQRYPGEIIKHRYYYRTTSVSAHAYYYVKLMRFSGFVLTCSLFDLLVRSIFLHFSIEKL